VWLTFETKSGIGVDCGSGKRPVESGGKDTYPIHYNYKDNEENFLTRITKHAIETALNRRP
jgi:hypothetical protein